VNTNVMLLPTNSIRLSIGISPRPLISEEKLFGSFPLCPIQFEKSFRKFEHVLKTKNWVELGSGRHRKVFGAPNKNIAIKVSKVPMGVQANVFEHHYATLNGHQQNAIQYNLGPILGEQHEDKCCDVPIPKVFGHTRVGHLSVLCVEFVSRVSPMNPEYKNATAHPWVKHVDRDGQGAQIGVTKRGRLVCFDWCVF
jgi:hypothetical protein